jgi:hypothetical protein
MQALDVADAAAHRLVSKHESFEVLNKVPLMYWTLNVMESECNHTHTCNSSGSGTAQAATCSLRCVRLLFRLCQCNPTPLHSAPAQAHNGMAHSERRCRICTVALRLSTLPWLRHTRRRLHAGAHAQTSHVYHAYNGR